MSEEDLLNQIMNFALEGKDDRLEILRNQLSTNYTCKKMYFSSANCHVYQLNFEERNFSKSISSITDILGVTLEDKEIDITVTILNGTLSQIVLLSDENFQLHEISELYYLELDKKRNWQKKEARDFDCTFLEHR